MSVQDAISLSSRPRRYAAEVASDPATVRATQALRYHVFAEEMGAHLHTRIEGLDYDEIDDYCDHLLVRDTQTGQIVACTRLLDDIQAARLGRFYSEGEFQLDEVLALPGRFLEIGRTCVDPSHRGSVVLGTLWNGLAEYVYNGRFNYLMGCASIPPGPSGFAVDAVYRQIEPHQFGPSELLVRSKNPVPAHKRCVQDESGIPPLLQAYLRLGCWVLGDPFWDEDFNVMDVFILLDLSRMQARYEKRFIASKQENSRAALSAVV
ncbi:MULTISPECIES: GNAT family N-acetyltransferase [Methylocaldum]|jgi:putative hemolysin|uniref:GNAT family N-acetyltransferase n=1 Tax=unclassified Methylocaldum TaxID=2622260 RepID=UPI00098B465C|nr:MULTISPECIES: GNAT family N-acyltransferase [unclassified Methylocaldum]MBP1149051.1 putative hemolysin [Methylocaldum sp. RMAD-M]MVF20247.1 GNAT family N-acetyltransferase [Methylocaldum sp. BRCS4]